ncbi:MAG: SocA family protein, partial [Sutterella sp.]|nr:SocA family protein [Sutterella sp.]
MFDIRKATHVAAYLLWKRGRRMSSLKLMKMMYIAEKQFLLQYGERLTGDKMVSMPYGPVLSATYDCFMGDREYWDSWIINPGNYDLALNSSIKV